MGLVRSQSSVRGSSHCSTNLATIHVLRFDTQPSETNLNEQLKSFWELESLGIKGEEKTLYDEFTSRVLFREGRYKVSLPWKEFHDPLPDNYSLSVNQLRGLLHRLRHDPNILKEYDHAIKDQLSQGIIEAIPQDESSIIRTHYLPHHAIIRQGHATTKLHVVYDALAKSDGPSLNECLHKGPKFNQLILDLLLRFHSYHVALTADVEKAFLMIGMSEDDRDVLRFLWVDDIHKDDPKLQIYHFTRVVFRVSSSPFLLNTTVKFHLEYFMDSHADIMKQLLLSSYVDDIVSGVDSVEQAFELYKQAKDLFQHGGFNLRKFLTNSRLLQEKIDLTEGVSVRVTPTDPSAETYSQAVLGMPSTEQGECKILGVTWNPDSDCLVFDVSSLAQLANSMPPTKRNLVSLIVDSLIHLDIWLHSLSSLKYCFRSFVLTSWSGMLFFPTSCYQNGRCWLMNCIKVCLSPFPGVTTSNMMKMQQAGVYVASVMLQLRHMQL